MNKIILDVDTGEDDALAVLLAVKNDLPLQYVVTSYGNTTLENATRNTAALLSLAHATHVKVIPGSEKSLSQHPHQQGNVSAGDFVGKNGLCNVDVPQNKLDNILDFDSQQFEKTVLDKMKELGSCDYIITGPCTNFARLLRKYKEVLPQYVKSIYIMGAAVYTPGNSGPKNPDTNEQCAEFNFYCDAPAAKEVIASGIPVYLISWDITSTVTIPYTAIEKMKSDTEVGMFTIALMKSFFKYYGLSHDRNFELNDPLTVVAQQGYGHYRTVSVDVITEGQEYGRTIESAEGSKVNYFFISEDEKREATQRMLHSLDITEI